MEEDLARMQMEKMMRESEKRIMDKLASSLEASEARILAAIGSGAGNNSAAAKSPAASYVPTMTPSAPSVMRQSAPVADEAKPAPVVRSRTTSVPKKMPSASLGNDGEVTLTANMAKSTLAPADPSLWKHMPDCKSTSGIQVEESCKEAYNRVRRSNTGVRWAMFSFDKKMSWVYPTYEGMSTEDYEQDWIDFVEMLPPKTACYALYNFEYQDEGGGGYAQEGADVMKSKMVLFTWADNKCKVKAKMVSASSQSAIKAFARGCMDYSCHDKADMGYEYMCKQLNC